MKTMFVVLANSVRSGQHCIAGREVTERDGQMVWGPWIRPVSRSGHGEVSPEECRCSDGTSPAPLDVVEVTLAGNQQSPHQPENFFIDPTIPWKRIQTMPPASLAAIEERPQSLWREPGSRTDRIHTTQAVGSVAPFQSLFLIRPGNLRFAISETMEESTGQFHKYRRAVFHYGDTHYRLSITDPTMDARYFQPFPAPGEPTREITPKSPENCMLVVSLAAPFTDGYRYKVVAAVLEL